MAFSLRTHTKIYFLITLATLAMLVYLAVSLEGERQRLEQQYHANIEVQLLSKDILQALTDRETGQRGYLLTLDEEFLEPYQAAGTRLDGLLDALKPHIDPSLWTAIVADVEDRHNYFEAGFALINGVDGEAHQRDAIEMVRSGTGKVFMDRFRARLTTILAQRSEMLDVATSELKNLEQRNHRIELVGVIVLLLLFVAPVMVISRRVVRPLEQLGDALKRLKQSGEVGFPDPKGAYPEIQSIVVETSSTAEHLLEFSALEEAKRQLQDALDKQKDMFAVIGHELRTPVASISMVTEDETTSETERLALIKEITGGLLNVLEDLRVVVSPERALEARTTSEDPIRIIKRALSPLNTMLLNKGMELKIDMQIPEGVLFELNGQALRQAVTNLVKNAVIHSQGQQIYLSFDYTVSAAKTAASVLRVEDNGKGIPEHQRERVFESFGRGDTDADGSGLGLYIVKQLAQMMNGDLVYSPSQYGGACFELTFEMRCLNKQSAVGDNVEPQYQQLEQSKRKMIEGVRVLLAEDDPMLRMLTEKQLTNLGASVTCCENGALALKAFDEREYDLILTDLMMPVMDGHELTLALRSRGVEAPIIGVTAAVVGKETEEWLRDGADAFISKPISVGKLTTTLASIGWKPAA